MIEKYCLNRDTLPTIPVPHDCVIKNININGEFLTFTFNSDIANYDSIKFTHPDAKSLIIRFHLLSDDGDSVDVYRSVPDKTGEWFDYKHINTDEFTALSGEQLEYLYHYVCYGQMMIKLWYTSYFLIELSSDYVEFEWEDVT